MNMIKNMLNYLNYHRCDNVELLTQLNAITDNHAIGSSALKMIEGVIQVSQMQVRDICVPSGQMTTIVSTDPLEKIIDVFTESHHSRIPVYDENNESILGILLAKDLLKYTINPTTDFTLRDFIHPVMFIPESKKLNRLLSDFQSKHMHMAIILDEYGGIYGLVTIEDVIEQIVGEIDDEHFNESNQETITEIDDQTFAVTGTTEIEVFNEYFQSSYDHKEVDTVGGMITSYLGYIPSVGETITYGMHNFKIKQSDPRRIKLMIVTAKDL